MLAQMEKGATNLTRWVGSTTSLVVHTTFFIAIFGLRYFGFTVNEILLILTTAVSLEAIYLSLFIQITVNRQAESLEDVEEDIDEIQDDIEEISEDIEQIQETEEADKHDESLDQIEGDLKKLLRDIEALRRMKALEIKQEETRV